MTENLLFRSIILWLSFIPIAILNGVIRESIYRQMVGDFLAHQISTVIAIIAFVGIALFVLGKTASQASTQELFVVGVLLVIATAFFEFGFGHYVDKASWEKLLTDYNFVKGHIWGLFLLTELVTPFIVKLLRR